MKAGEGMGGGNTFLPVSDTCILKDIWATHTGMFVL